MKTMREQVFITENRVSGDPWKVLWSEVLPVKVIAIKE